MTTSVRVLLGVPGMIFLIQTMLWLTAPERAASAHASLSLHRRDATTNMCPTDRIAIVRPD